MIVLDTSFLFALKSIKDKNHDRAIQILEALLKKYKKLKLIPYLVLSETLTLAIARYQGNIQYLEKFYDLFWGSECFFKIITFEKEEYKRIYQILEKYCNNERKLSYTDASLIYVYEKYKSKFIVSFDSHFDNISNRLY